MSRPVTSAMSQAEILEGPRGTAITFSLLGERTCWQATSVWVEEIVIEKLRLTTRIVDDQDEALRFYTEKLGLVKRADEPFGPDNRWVTVAPERDETVEIVLELPAWSEDEEEADRRAAMVGEQPALAFTVDDCHATYETLRDRGVEFTAKPEEQPYGIEAVARDLYGNGVVLVEREPEAETT